MTAAQYSSAGKRCTSLEENIRLASRSARLSTTPPQRHYKERMEYVHLGRAGVKVSRLCLGTMNFGPLTSEQDSFAIMDRALELGINFFDTANVYGWKLGEGLTEQIVGRWLSQGQGRRDKIVLATKVFGRMGDWPNQSRLSALHIKRACEDSLRRLKTDHIDLYQMHHVDRECPWEEIWQAMEQLVREGKILYIGSSNFAGWHLARAQELAAQRHFLGLVSEQSLYNLHERMVELEVIPACEAYGIGLIPWSPLARGLLAGALQPVSSGRRADEDLRKEVETNRARLEGYDRLCAQLGERPADVALAWLLHQPAVTAPIIGPRTLDQLNGSMRALSLSLSQDSLKRLDELFPGPGGRAPEAYAW
ncbi:putative oxidoreductase YrpG [Nitrospira tepida]|uniref:Oxidoreductase YrpG n=2 Tax=Nitrospira tepida TaxID=2973512 RepID=A0AA86N1M6_9BACT|nr:putative oxidoreductase YrpG [Nitrospira tepida]